MNIIRWKCGCIQIENENVFIYYCEGDGADGYGFYISDRKCNDTYEILDEETKQRIFICIQNHVIRSGEYKDLQLALRQTIKHMFN